MKLLAATRSAGKQREFRRVLEPAGVEVVFPDDVGLYPTQAEDTLELGETLRGQRPAEGGALRPPQRPADRGRRLRARGLFPRRRARRPLPPLGRRHRRATRRWTPPTTPSWCAGWPGRARLAARARYRCVLVYLRDARARSPRVRGHLRRPDSRGAPRARAGSATIPIS